MNSAKSACCAKLYLSDDYGDNICTLRCQLPLGHDGNHTERFHRDSSGTVTVTWERDEKEATDA